LFKTVEKPADLLKIVYFPLPYRLPCRAGLISSMPDTAPRFKLDYSPDFLLILSFIFLLTFSFCFLILTFNLPMPWDNIPSPTPS